MGSVRGTRVLICQVIRGNPRARIEIILMAVAALKCEKRRYEGRPNSFRLAMVIFRRRRRRRRRRRKFVVWAISSR